MTYEEMLALLTDEQRALIQGKVHEKNTEAKGLREAKIAQEAMLAKVKAQLGVEDLNDEVLAGITSKLSDKMTADEKLKALERKLLEKDTLVSKLQGDLGDMTQAQREKARDEEVIAAIGKLGLRPEAYDGARKLINLDAKYDKESNAWQFNGEALDAYLAKWKEANSYLLANPVAPGTTKPGPKGGPGTAPLVKFTKQQYEAMSAAERKVHHKEILLSVPHWGIGG